MVFFLWDDFVFFLSVLVVMSLLYFFGFFEFWFTVVVEVFIVSGVVDVDNFDTTGGDRNSNSFS